MRRQRGAGQPQAEARTVHRRVQGQASVRQAQRKLVRRLGDKAGAAIQFADGHNGRGNSLSVERRRQLQGQRGRAPGDAC